MHESDYYHSCMSDSSRLWQPYCAPKGVLVQVQVLPAMKWRVTASVLKATPLEHPILFVETLSPIRTIKYI